MVDRPLDAEIRRRIGSPLSDDEVAALADWYVGLGNAVASFPATDLAVVEPPLRSTPGPRA